MEELFTLLQAIIERGLLFSFVVAAVYLSSSLIKFDNLAIEGAFGLGGAVTAYLLTKNFHPLNALIGSIIAGALSGFATGLLQRSLHLKSLISGIVITTGLFSITLKIAGSNMPLNNKSTIFTLLPFIAHQQTLLILSLFCISVFLALAWFLKTQIGLLLYTLGDSAQVLTNIGKNITTYTLLGLLISNALAALSGALFVHYTGYFSIWANVGVLIIGLAGMFIAQAFNKNFGLHLIIGSCIYQVIIALTFELHLDQDWNKLVTAFIIVLVIACKEFLTTNKEESL